MTPMRSLVLLGSFLLVSFGVGCDAGSPVVCPAVEEPAVVVEVADATTSEAIAEEARGVLIDGAYSDSLRAIATNAEGEDFLLGGAYERVGTYEVRIEKDGYGAWIREGVKVGSGDCGTETVRLTARLVRL